MQHPACLPLAAAARSARLAQPPRLRWLRLHHYGSLTVTSGLTYSLTGGRLGDCPVVTWHGSDVWRRSQRFFVRSGSAYLCAGLDAWRVGLAGGARAAVRVRRWPSAAGEPPPCSARVHRQVLSRCLYMPACGAAAFCWRMTCLQVLRPPRCLNSHVLTAPVGFRFNCTVRSDEICVVATFCPTRVNIAYGHAPPGSFPTCLLQRCVCCAVL